MNDIKNIPEGWVKTNLGEVVNIFSGKTRPLKTGEFPVYGGNGILNFGNEFNQENETLIIGRVGEYCGNVFYENRKFWLSDNALGIKTNRNIDIRFMYNKLSSMKLNNYSIGGAQPLLTQSLLKELELIIPLKESEQKSIAAILTSFDDKIELLQDQNKTLEETAQTIFKEWFGKYQIGEELPEGWRVGKLGEIAEKISKGTTPVNNDIVGLKGTIPFLKVKDISNEGLILINNLEFIPDDVHKNQLKRSVLKTNDILFSIAGTIGRVAIIDSRLNNANCNQALAFIRLNDKLHFLEYIHLWFKSKSVQDEINSNIVQGVQANVSLTVLANLSLIIPNSNTIDNWLDLIKPIYGKLQTNNSQIQTLTQTRDELLPKLMSGEIRVNEFNQ